MVIKKGEPWGRPGERPTDLRVAKTDADAASLVASGAAMLGLAAGDLLATLGGNQADSSDDGAREGGVEHQHLPIDLGWVGLDGGQSVPFVAHVAVHRRFWLGEFAVIMNAAWIDDLYLGPRAHPNDGLLDITVGALPVRQLVQARARARTGSHLPHPALTASRTASWEHRFARPIPVWIDGVLAGRATEITVKIESDSAVVVI